MSELDFTGRTAIVTGAGKGLGRAYARWLAARGCAVVASNRLGADGASSAQATAAEIADAGGRAVAYDGPVESAEAAAEMVALARSSFGGLDILICNAGVSRWRDFSEVTPEEMRPILEVNLWGSVLPMKAAWPVMQAQGYGRIVLTASSAGLWGQMQSAAYSMSKAAMVGLARSATLDVPEGLDLCVNVIAPAAYTPMSSKAMDERWADYCSPDKVAPVVGWLASDRCQVSGGIYHAGAGHVRRVQVLEGPVVELEGRPIDEVMSGLQALPEPKSSFGSGAELMPELAAAAREA